jgi:hypothetical protein
VSTRRSRPVAPSRHRERSTPNQTTRGRPTPYEDRGNAFLLQQRRLRRLRRQGADPRAAGPVRRVQQGSWCSRTRSAAIQAGGAHAERDGVPGAAGRLVRGCVGAARRDERRPDVHPRRGRPDSRWPACWVARIRRGSTAAGGRTATASTVSACSRTATRVARRRAPRMRPTCRPSPRPRTRASDYRSGGNPPLSELLPTVTDSLRTYWTGATTEFDRCHPAGRRRPGARRGELRERRPGCARRRGRLLHHDRHRHLRLRPSRGGA